MVNKNLCPSYKGIEVLVLLNHFVYFNSVSILCGTTHRNISQIFHSTLSYLREAGCGTIPISTKQIYNSLAGRQRVEPNDIIEHFNSIISKGRLHEDPVFQQCWEEVFLLYPPTPDGLLQFLAKRYFPILNGTTKKVSHIYAAPFIHRHIYVNWNARKKNNLSI